MKPELDVVPGTNIVDTTEHDCVSVLLDKFERDAAKRYKNGFVVEFNTGASVSMQLKYSADGIHWSEPKALGELYDRCAAYYDLFRGKYVLLKTINGKKYRRSRCFWHTKTLKCWCLAYRVYDNKSDKFIKYWFNAEDNDPRHPDFPEIRPQI